MSVPERAPVQPLALNVEDACAALGISWQTWKEHVEPHIRLVRVGRRKIVPITALQEWLDANAEAVGPQ